MEIRVFLAEWLVGEILIITHAVFAATVSHQVWDAPDCKMRSSFGDIKVFKKCGCKMDEMW